MSEHTDFLDEIARETTLYREIINNIFKYNYVLRTKIEEERKNILNLFDDVTQVGKIDSIDSLSESERQVTWYQLKYVSSCPSPQPGRLVVARYQEKVKLYYTSEEGKAIRVEYDESWNSIIKDIYDLFTSHAGIVENYPKYFSANYVPIKKKYNTDRAKILHLFGDDFVIGQIPSVDNLTSDQRIITWEQLKYVSHTFYEEGKLITVLQGKPKLFYYTETNPVEIKLVEGLDEILGTIHALPPEEGAWETYPKKFRPAKLKLGWKNIRKFDISQLKVPTPYRKDDVVAHIPEVDNLTPSQREVTWEQLKCVTAYSPQEGMIFICNFNNKSELSYCSEDDGKVYKLIYEKSLDQVINELKTRESFLGFLDEVYPKKFTK